MPLAAQNTLSGRVPRYIQVDSLVKHSPIVAEDDDPVVVTYRVSNSSGHTIVFDGIHTSCSCVEAEVIPPRLKAGDSAEVRVTYRQKGHPGRHERTIWLSSKDKEYARLTLISEVTPSMDRAADYPQSFGLLRLTRKSVRFRKGIRSVERIACYNASTDAVQAEVMEGLLPKGVKAGFEKRLLLPGEETDMVVEYDGGEGVHVSDKAFRIKIIGTGLPAHESYIELYFE